jgi:predicted acylesterase/phospholipase RssA
LPAPNEPLSLARPLGFEDPVRIVDDGPASFRIHSVEVVNRLRASAGGGEINVLALSGGGGGGAFGAGALTGLTRSGRRPPFHLVTGVSTGALIAPLAFLGSDWDSELREAFAGQSADQLLKRRILSLVFGSALYDGKRLRNLVDRFVTDQLIRAVAIEAKRGRMLLVETTDLDKAEPVIWDMGAIAIRGGPEARTLFRDVLIASASIPSIFPPVLIRVRANGVIADELHVDGSTTLPMFIAPEMAAVVPESFAGAERINVYVIVNGQLGARPKTTRIRSLNLVSRSIEANLLHNDRAAVALAYNIAMLHGMNFRLTAIPGSYPYRGPLDFRARTMASLFEFATKCAAQGRLWMTPELTYEIAAHEHPPATAAMPTCPFEASSP